LTSNHEDRPLVTGFLGLLAGWSFIGSGLVARARAPQNPIGRLMVAVGFAFFAGSLRWSNSSVPFTVGLAVGSLWAAVLVHLLLDGLAVVVLGTVIVLVLRRWHAATRPERRVLAPVLLSGFVASALLVADIVVGAVSRHWSRPLDLLLVAAFASVPLFFLLGLLQTRLARAGVGRLLVEVPDAPTRGHTQDALRRALRDPTLQLAYWLPERRAYVDVDGEPVELPPEGGERVATTVEDVHGSIAAL